MRSGKILVLLSFVALCLISARVALAQEPGQSPPSGGTSGAPKAVKPPDMKRFLQILGADPYEAAAIVLAVKAPAAQITVSPPKAKANKEGERAFDSITYYLSNGRVVAVEAESERKAGGLRFRKQVYQAIVGRGDVVRQAAAAEDKKQKVVVLIPNRKRPTLRVALDPVDARDWWQMRVVPAQEKANPPNGNVDRIRTLASVPLLLGVRDRQLVLMLRAKKLTPTRMFLEAPELRVGEATRVPLGFVACRARKGNTMSYITGSGSLKATRAETSGLYEVLRSIGKVTKSEKVIVRGHHVGYRVETLFKVKNGKTAIAYIDWSLAVSDPEDAGYLKFIIQMKAGQAPSP